MRNETKFNAVGRLLLEWLKEAEVRPGQRLPSERYFAEKLDVSRPTVNKAIAALISQGVLRRDGYKLKLLGPPPATTLAGNIHLIYPANWCPQFLDGVAHVARIFGLGLATHDIESARREIEFYEQIAIAGEQPCLIWPLHEIDRLKKSVAALRRVVVIDLEVPGLPYVASDNSAAGALAASHLCDLGHRHIAQVILPSHFNSLQERSEGFQTECVRRRLKPPGGTMVEAPTRDLPGMAAVVARLRAQHPKVTGIFVPTDTEARWLIQSARLRGIRVPEDWSVISHDNDWAAGLNDPPQTTVGQDFFQIGAAATSQLYQLMRMNARPLIVPALRVRPFLVVRGTTAPCHGTAH